MAIFIGGYARTGTTLIQGIVCSDRDTFPVTKESYYLKSLVAAYEHGKRIWDIHTFDYFDDINHFYNFHKNIIDQYLCYIKSRWGKNKKIVQKQPMMVIYFPEIMELVENSLFIVMVRDPRDTIASQIVRYKKQNNFQKYSINQLLEEYLQRYNRIISNKSFFQDKLTFIRYENLVNFPNYTIEKLRNFTNLELPFKPEQDKWETKRSSHDESASPLDGELISQKSIGNYINILSQNEIHEIENQIERINNFFGFNVFLDESLSYKQREYISSKILDKKNEKHNFKQNLTIKNDVTLNKFSNNQSKTSYSKTQPQQNVIQKYPSLNTLLFFQSPREYYRPILFSHNEIFCSPACETEIKNESFRTIKTPVGIFDTIPIANKIPDSQKPELVVVKADAARRVFPINLDRFNCPKLLIVGDTHHLQTPLQTLLAYAKEENFDFVMTIPNPRHLHYFQEAGFEKTFWIPTFHIDPHPQEVNQNYEHLISFVGQAGQFHPYRRYILDQVRKAGFPINQLQAPRSEAAQVYANSLISLNISLNGDVNMRIFEVLSSGGFLLTDKLSKQSRLEDVLEEGKHFVAYKDETDLVKKIEYYTQHPDKAREIAAEGKKVLWANYRPDLNIQRVIDYINGKEIEPYCYANWDKRSIHAISDNSQEFTGRITIYEYIQEWHRIEPHIQGICFPDVNYKLISDLVDLPRLNLYIFEENNENLDTTKTFLGQCEVIEQVSFIDSPENKKWDFIALTVAELSHFDIESLVSNIDFKELVIADYAQNLFKVQLLDHFLANYGLVKSSQNPVVYKWSIKQKFKLREVNLLVFPDWNQPEEKLSLDLANVMKAISNHPDLNQITLIIDISNLSEEDANLMLSGVAMNLMMEEGIELSEKMEISFIGNFDNREWNNLLPHIQGRLKLNHENLDRISQFQGHQIPIYEINTLNKYRVIQSKQGLWSLFKKE